MIVKEGIDCSNLYQLEPITKKQEGYLTYLVCSLVDYGRKLYIMGNKLGYVVPVLIPKGYNFTVEYAEELSKGEALEIIGHLKRKQLDQICRVTASKIYLDGSELNLSDFLMGKRVIVGIENC